MRLKWTRDRDGEGYHAYGQSWYSIRYIIAVESGWCLSMQDVAGTERHRTLQAAKAAAQGHEDEYCAAIHDELTDAVGG
jgi:hypothetical protein